TKPRGRVQDVQKTPISVGCVGVFSEGDEKLLASAPIAADGSFAISGVRDGSYRLVVAVTGFCAANAKITVGKGFRRKRNLIAIMKPRGIDECSWMEATD